MLANALPGVVLVERPHWSWWLTYKSGRRKTRPVRLCNALLTPALAVLEPGLRLQQPFQQGDHQSVHQLPTARAQPQDLPAARNPQTRAPAPRAPTRQGVLRTLRRGGAQPHVVRTPSQMTRGACACASVHPTAGRGHGYRGGRHLDNGTTRPRTFRHPHTGSDSDSDSDTYTYIYV
ncbi:hypothetical protein MKEN_00863200 [Mycena kentingensis (nom. inval.)]|nr:hypothetical protein MKEN_00863200 [Mycena kentingensis (nom. inval.)]